MAEDARLDRLLDYTKFHIGIYLAMFGGMATIVAAAVAEPTKFELLGSIFAHRWALLVAGALMALAGLAGGVVASCCTQAKSFDKLWTEKQGPGTTEMLEGRLWALLEHGCFWLSIGFLTFSLLGSKRAWAWFLS